MTFKIKQSSEAEEEAVHRLLQAYNARFMRDPESLSFHIAEGGKIIAGIVASCVGDTAEVDFLFVDENYRGRGLGRKLLEHMEDVARKKRLCRAILNTYSFQAPGFYQKLGYREVFKLEPCFDNFAQFYFIKELSQ